MEDVDGFLVAGFEVVDVDGAVVELHLTASPGPEQSVQGQIHQPGDQVPQGQVHGEPLFEGAVGELEDFTDLSAQQGLGLFFADVGPADSGAAAGRVEADDGVGDARAVRGDAGVVPDAARPGAAQDGLFDPDDAFFEGFFFHVYSSWRSGEFPGNRKMTNAAAL